jgi:hypothetical protein
MTDEVSLKERTEMKKWDLVNEGKYLASKMKEKQLN